MKPSWQVIRRDGEYHVEPIEDIVAHQKDDCICGPTTESVFQEDGSSRWLHTHHALDGRE